MIILLVEDDPVNQQVGTLTLKKLGYSSIIASDGREAIEILTKETFDLVLMDLQMPVMDGYETAKTIRDINSPVMDHKIPIVALTAHALDTDRKRCMDVGMDDYITKPFRKEKLDEVIKKWGLKTT